MQRNCSKDRTPGNNDSDTTGAPEGTDAGSLTDKENLDIVRAIHEVDACEFCHGTKGGVPGNENILTIDGVKMIACDYCTAQHREAVV